MSLRTWPRTSAHPYSSRLSASASTTRISRLHRHVHREEQVLSEQSRSLPPMSQLTVGPPPPCTRGVCSRFVRVPILAASETRSTRSLPDTPFLQVGAT